MPTLQSQESSSAATRYSPIGALSSSYPAKSPLQNNSIQQASSSASSSSSTANAALTSATSASGASPFRNDAVPQLQQLPLQRQNVPSHQSSPSQAQQSHLSQNLPLSPRQSDYVSSSGLYYRPQQQQAGGSASSSNNGSANGTSQPPISMLPYVPSTDNYASYAGQMEASAYNMGPRSPGRTGPPQQQQQHGSVSSSVSKAVPEFRRVRGPTDLRPKVNHQPAFRRAAPEGGFISVSFGCVVVFSCCQNVRIEPKLTGHTPPAPPSPDSAPAVDVPHWQPELQIRVVS